MPVSCRLRARHQTRLRRPPAEVRRAANKRYPGFPDEEECWEQSKTHRDYFLKYLDCAHKSNYHHDMRGCKPFDDLLTRWATTRGLARSFFTHYNILGRPPRGDFRYLSGLISDRSLLTRYSQCSLRKKLNAEYRDGDLPPVQHAGWPLNFNLFDSYFDDEERAEALEAVEKCITRRIMFRNACVKACSTKNDTESHDKFLLILQILRAQLVVD